MCIMSATLHIYLMYNYVLWQKNMKESMLSFIHCSMSCTLKYINSCQCNIPSTLCNVYTLVPSFHVEVCKVIADSHFDVLTSYISFRRVPSSDKVTSQRVSFQPIAAQLPRSSVALPAVPWSWRCYGNKTTTWRHIIDIVRAHMFWNEMRRQSC
jgi:hypothetical protein